MYNPDHAEFISDLESQGLSWDNITKQFNEKFCESKTSNAIRKTFARFKPVTQKLHGFNIHETPMKELFRQADLSPKEILRVVVQPDTHVRNRDKKAMGAFCSFLKHYRPHMLVNLGDYMDMDAVSHWPSRNTTPRRFVEELKEGIELLEQIGESAGEQCTIKRFIIGNHEDWLNQYLSDKIPEFIGGIEEVGVDLSIEKLLRLRKFGYEVIPLNEILRIGSANFIHGYYTGGSHAKKHLDVFGSSIYYGHLHDTQSYSSVSIHGTFEAMSLGCLCRLDASFLRGKPNNWQHAFGIFEFRLDGNYTRYVPTMSNGQFSYNGKLF